MQSKELQETTYVIGHKNPDTDSICSAICYAALKERTGGSYTPARAGQINDETRFVLEHFAVPVPRLMETVETQVRDIQIRRTKGVRRGLSIKRAWNLMPVSYTHLDVYKRQISSRSASAVQNRAFLIFSKFREIICLRLTP